jgi:small-conductance mechanosensitive channel
MKLSALVAFVVLFVTAPSRASVTPFDHSTPRRTVVAFLEAASAHDYEGAATLLDLHALAPPVREKRGPELAQQLRYVLDRSVWIEPELLSDDPQGNPTDGHDTERITSVRADGVDVPITLTHLAGDGGWAISATTVARIPHLYEAYQPGWLESRVPASLRVRFWGLFAWQWIGLLAIVVIAVVFGRLATYAGGGVARRVAKKTRAPWAVELVAGLRRPSRFLFGVLAFDHLADYLALSAAADHVLAGLVAIITIGAVAWATIAAIGVLSRVLERHVVDSAQTTGDAALRARGVRTQVRVLRRVVNVAVAIIAIALMLTRFELMRNIGVSLLASAGVAGVVLGFAAQRTIGSLIAGIQLSFTQPIRIGDVVVIEKEWGTIEEVTLTFVVVRIWDERRLIVPMSRFLEAPFENWTKTSPELHGTVFVYADWRLPIEALRSELDRILEGNRHWDRRTKNVSVTNTTDRTVEVRALVSAANADDLWDLRVEVRERLIGWLQQFEGGRYLPCLRVESASIESRAQPHS